MFGCVVCLFETTKILYVCSVYHNDLEGRWIEKKIQREKIQRRGKENSRRKKERRKDGERRSEKTGGNLEERRKGKAEETQKEYQHKG